MTGSVWGQITTEIDAGLNKAHIQWQDQFWSYLETSEHAQFRTAAAVRLLQAGDPKIMGRGVEIIEEVLSTPIPDSVSLWLLASDCQFRNTMPWCEPGGVYEMLSLADPDNATVQMLRFSQSKRSGDEASLDTEANRQLLLKAANADRFDVYWGRGADKLYEEALRYAEINPPPPIPEFEPPKPQLVVTPHTYAFHAAMGQIITSPTAGYGNMFDLCRVQAVNQRTELIKACKKLARLLRGNGYSNITRSIGYGMEKAMLKAVDPDDPRIQSWNLRSQVFGIVQMCYLTRWQTSVVTGSEASVETIMNWSRNLDEWGEWKGNKLTSIQEYIASPNDFEVNPADCDKLFDLDEEDMARLVEDRQSYSEWLRNDQ